MRHLILLVLLSPLLSQAQQAEKSIEVMLPVKKVHEECMALEVGQTLKFSYEANAELEFNLHFHHGKDVTYPLKGKYSNYSNAYNATEKNDFCLMWQNKSAAPVKLQTTFSVN
jgi:hypothetical protein